MHRNNLGPFRQMLNKCAPYSTRRTNHRSAYFPTKTIQIYAVFIHTSLYASRPWADGKTFNSLQDKRKTRPNKNYVKYALKALKKKVILKLLKAILGIYQRPYSGISCLFPKCLNTHTLYLALLLFLLLLQQPHSRK